MNPKSQSSSKNFTRNNQKNFKINGRNVESNTSNRNQNNQTLIPVGAKWYRQKLQNLPDNKSSNRLSHNEITQLREEAFHQLKCDYYTYDQQCKNQSGSSSKREDFEWIQTVLQNGTVSDKLAAHTVLIQDSSAYNLKSLEQLVRFVNPKGKRECMMAIDTLKDLFIGDLLIPKHKLQSFEELVNSVDQNFLSSNQDSTIRRKFLLLAYVEDQIRSLYRRFLDQLVQCTHDTLEALKLKSIRILFDLFISNPEQEKFILENLINKLGDPTAKIASSVARLLANVLQQHPPMKSIIVKEVERLLFRPNVSERTQYYCLCFLSEIIYQKNTDESLANQVIECYFTVFTKCTKKGELNNKTMSVLLTGVARAFPYSKLPVDIIEKYLNTFYRLIHYIGTNTAIQTLSLIFQMVNMTENGSLSDRFYSSLYRFLLQNSDSFDHCSKLSLLLNICYRAMKRDPVMKRCRAFVKRLLQISMLSSTSFTVAILILVSELMKTKPGFRLETAAPTSSNEDQLCSSTKDGATNAVCNKKFENEEDEEQNVKPAGGWVFVDLKNEHDNKQKCKDEDGENGAYRFDVRNPLYANAEYEPIWELGMLCQHFHPTVRMYARQLSQDEPFTYDGDPLEDFSLKRFLDRFSFKNPKRFDEKTSEQQKRNVFSRQRRPMANRVENIHSDDYLKQTEQQVPIDERFIYKFLQERKSLKQKSDVDPDGDDSDIESVTSLEFNDLLDNYEKYMGQDDDAMVDYAKDIHKSNINKNKTRNMNLEDDDEDADFDEEFDDDDEDLDMDEDDDDDDSDIQDDNDDDDDIDQDSEPDDDFSDQDFQFLNKKIKKPRNAAPFKGKESFGKLTNDIFASAEQFDHLLDQNDDAGFDSDDFDQDSDDDDKQKRKSKRKMNSKNNKNNKNRTKRRKKIH